MSMLSKIDLCFLFSRKRVLLTAALLLLVPPLVAQPRIEPVPGDYRLVNGKVDSGTYTGWRIFHTACFGCHGVGGVGLTAADLTVGCDGPVRVAYRGEVRHDVDDGH